MAIRDSSTLPLILSQIKSKMFSDVQRCSWMFSRCSQDVLITYEGYSGGSGGPVGCGGSHGSCGPGGSRGSSGSLWFGGSFGSNGLVDRKEI